MKQNSAKKQLLPALALVIGFLVFFSSALAAKTVKEDLDEAKKTGKTVFLVVTGNGVNANNAMKIAQQAKKQIKESVVLTLNRDDKSNSELVTKMGLISVPLPFLMVVGMNGIVSGGVQEKDATADKLVQMAPSPRKAEALNYLGQKKPVFIIAYKKSFKDRGKVVENCKEAVKRLKGNAAFVEVDLDDPREKAFLEQVGGDFNSKVTQILVFNTQGKNTENFDGPTDPAKLSSAALMVPKSGCSPGSCAPGTKGCGK